MTDSRFSPDHGPDHGPDHAGGGLRTGEPVAARRTGEPAHRAAEPAGRGSSSTERPRAFEPRAFEIGGYDGPEPTRYGDWEHHGRCTDF